MGLESLYFINNVGSFFFVIAFQGFLVTIWLLLTALKWLGIETKVRKTLGKKLFWENVSGPIFESFLNVNLCALICFKYNFVTDT